MKRRILSILLATVMLLSLMTGLAATTSARTYSGTEKLYLDLSAISWWENDNPSTRAYFFGDSGEAWTTFTKGEIYSTTIPAGNWNAVVVVRANPAVEGWDGKYNQTGDIALSDSMNCIVLTDKGEELGDARFEVTWKNYGGSTPVDPTPGTSGDYYLFGYINGADYGEHDDYERIGDYHFEGGKLTATFTQESYVAVKTGDNNSWYMTDGWKGDVTSVTLYNTNNIPENPEDPPNKLKVPGGVAVTFTLTEGANDTLTLSYTTNGSVTPTPVEGAESKVILHCWNWSYDEIRNYLPQIKAAGYTAIQTSPAQVPKGYKNPERDDEVSGNWWALYQPVSFCIAPTDNDSYLGGKESLRKLCSAAEAQGIEVIVDIVSNHVGNGWNDLHDVGIDPEQGISGGGKLFWITPSGEIADYGLSWLLEKTGSATNPSYKYFRDYVKVNDATTESTVHGNIELPDLKTETKQVQDMVTNYLKELIDVGVDGFRFDAAKHIETPEDGMYASDYWPNVIGAAKTYAKETKNVDLWCYGEILSNAGHDRKMNYYVPYMDMTEISYAYTIIQGFGDNKGASTVANQLFKDWLGVGTETLAPSTLVLMAESHDMYADGTSARYDSTTVNKAWAVAAARADTSALYLARSRSYSGGSLQGTMGKCENMDWSLPEVAAVNKFHNAFIGAAEQVYASDNFVVVERFGAAGAGAVIVNAAGRNATVSVNLKHLTDGTYYDQITGAALTVSAGRLTGTMGATGILVLRSTEPTQCEHTNTYTVTIAPSCTEPGYIRVYCQDCGLLLSETPNGQAMGHIDLDGDHKCDRCGETMPITVYLVDALGWVAANDSLSKINAYAYSTGGGEIAAWPGVSAESVGTTKDGYGIWKIGLSPSRFNVAKFVGHPGAENEVKTVNLSFAEDAGTKDYVIYTTTEETETDEFGGQEYKCTAGGDIKEICTHSSFSTVRTANCTETKICDCCGEILGVSQLPHEYANGVCIYCGAVDPYHADFCAAFRDVDRTAWYHGAVDYALANSLMNGTSTTTFEPNGTMTRSMLVQVLYNLEGKPTVTGSSKFTDVKGDEWFAKAVIWASENGIVAGYDNGKFGVEDPVTREQIASILYRYANYKGRLTGKPVDLSSFPDARTVSTWAKLPMIWAVGTGFISGKGQDNGTSLLAPGGNGTRAEVASMFMRFVQNVFPVK